jgi:demethylmenaquinone methyltransferase/2-methoxy-6-polyprenyl-1,4-benzoquinol methylase
MIYCLLPFGGEHNVRDELIAPIDFSSDEKILDMCCGTGGATFAIAGKVGPSCRIVGMDLSSGQLRIANKKNRFDNIEFCEGDAGKTDFDDGYFDKVFITHALHEMSRDKRLQVLREARRIVKKNGLMVVLEVDNPDSIIVRLLAGLWLFYWLPFNFETVTRRDMIKSGLANEVAKAGFENINKISKFRGVMQIVTGEKLKQ